MPESLREIQNTISGREVLLDTNLLLLYLCGLFDVTWAGRHKRLDLFRPDDFEQVRNFVDHFKRVVTTPSILTELMHFLEARDHQSPRSAQERLRLFLAERIAIMDERYIPTARHTGREAFLRLGLTDTGIILLGESGVVVMTIDLPLYLALQQAGVSAINYNHYRRTS